MDMSHHGVIAGASALALCGVLLVKSYQLHKETKTLKESVATLNKVAADLVKAVEGSSSTGSDGAAAGAGAGAGAGVHPLSNAGIDRNVHIKELVETNDRLHRQLMAATEGNHGDYASGIAPKTLVHSKSVLSDGTEVDISKADMSFIRELFDRFDTNHNGSIDADELQAVHRKLGEPITAEEARTAMREMNATEDGVNFDNFVMYWHQMHKPDAVGASRKGRRYAARFKFLRAKMHNLQVADIYARPVGAPSTNEYRVFFFTRDAAGVETRISAWHDIPYKNMDDTYNFVVEIPKWTRKKYEISTVEEFNPIKQDVKNGRLREYKWGDMCFNYGAIPQTWEDPHHIDTGTGAKGDNDPIDVVELGGRSWGVGSVVPIKVLGVLALIDSGETDWKLITINTEDPLADRMNDVADVEAQMPGAISAIREWFRVYKMPTVENQFGFHGVCKDAAFAKTVVEETHGFWAAREKAARAAEAAGEHK